VLYGIMTGLSAFAFMGKVEDATAGRIDWSLTGSLGEPWPPDAWIEGNNGHGAMRVSCNGHRTEFSYDEYIRNDELLSDELASAVIAFLDRSLPDDSPQ